MSTKVEIRNITKSYEKGKPVLKPVSFTVEPGELFFLLGSSGCGKSTLLRIIAGLLAPDSGSILFNGKDITDLAPEKRRAAMVFQNYALWPHMTVAENVAFGLKIQGESASVIRTKVAEMLELVRLSDCGKRRIQSLSGGQQQRVALARALAVNPAVLLLDEPLSNLDACLRDEMRLEIRRICKERSLTAFYVTHDRKEALSMADRIAVLHQGTLRQTGTPVELYTRPVESFVASFLGDANLIPGTVKSSSPEGVSVETALGILNCRAPQGFSALPGMKTSLMIRPGDLHFTRAPGDDSFEAEPKEMTYLGERTEWRFAAAEGIPVTLFEPSAENRPLSGKCRLSVSPEHTTLLPGETK